MPAALPGRNEICAKAIDIISGGTPAKQAARDLEIAWPTLHSWLTSDEWSDRYARARELCAHAMAEDILEIADDGKNDWMQKNDPDNPGYTFNGEHSQRSRLRVDSRKWLLSKILPKQYGDKLQTDSTVTHKFDGMKDRLALKIHRVIDATPEGSADSKPD